MSATWQSDTPPPEVRLTPFGILRAFLKAVPLFFLIFGGLSLLLALRLLEKPIFGSHRPITPYLTVTVCKGALWIIGLRLQVVGQPIKGRGAIVANHSSWLDIFVLNASKRIYFVSKDDVAGWPGIGWLAKATGTVFIERNRTKAAEQAEVFRSRLMAGHKLLFFPEGTSSDGTRVLPFKSTLFAAFFDPTLQNHLKIQPVSVRYQAPDGQDTRFFAWWGDMDFGSHFLRILAQGGGGAARVTYHDELDISQFESRKLLAQTCENTVRAGWSDPTLNR